MNSGNTAVSSIMRELSVYIAGALKKPLPKDVFSGERNFLFAFSRATAPEKLTDGLGQRYEVVNTNIKRCAVGSPIQAALDSLAAHDDHRMRDPKVLAIKQRIELLGNEELERAPTRQAIVIVKTRDGRELKHHTLAVRGTAANPMTRLEVEEKCYDLMVPVLRARRARVLIETVCRIEKVADIRALRPLLRA